MADWSDRFKDIVWALQHNRKAQILLVVAVSLVIILIVLYVVLWRYQNTTTVETTADSLPTNDETAVSAEVAATTKRRIDGVMVATDVSNLLPVAVMVENLVTVRPQAGLGQANLVYEALAEGGITRFMAIYATADRIDRLGPVRSARHYFVDWAEEYGGIYAYVGGSPQALGVTNSSDYITDLNQFSNAQYYYRDTALAAPHNLFTTSELLSYALRDLELTAASGQYEPYLFKDNADKADRPTEVQPIVVDFSSADYQVEWHYDRDTNSYLRWNGGNEHSDSNTSEQLRAKNIVIQWTAITLIDEATGRLDVVTTGEGEAWFFRDGSVLKGSWVKSQRGQRTRWLDADGQPVKFNPGTTWIEVLPLDQTVSY